MHKYTIIIVYDVCFDEIAVNKPWMQKMEQK